MKRIDVKRIPSFDPKKYKRKKVATADGPLRIDEPCDVYCGNEHIISIRILPEKCRDVAKELIRVKFDWNQRTGGERTLSRIFGYVPRRPVFMKNFCSSTNMHEDAPNAYRELELLADTVNQMYKEALSNTWQTHNVTTEQVLDDWRIKGTVFTSGIVNKNNALVYHYDRGNFKDVYSCQVSFTKGLSGGNLLYPEFGFHIALPDNSVTFFDGQKYMHGVSPIRLKNKYSYRYTIVYYSLKNMWTCLPIGEELKNAQITEADRVKIKKERINAKIRR